ncbi:PHB depolymerase family esterase [Stigmatella sp. ncwal1]|uniref:PHB depolymerase family esterase n=1 Tax=Stigmatella ashevillensis TaxID=2995309 RepID=A0ABT5DBE0_9BACT|nr:PHB depolymerase family esterase [Stigmatella ashevillena]MDC0709636.1 PHB depolymerase family esterase [Stigmatella ashevillena]
MTYVSETRRIDSGGISRSFLLVHPASATAGQPLPIVFALHGDGGNGAGIRADLALESAATTGAIFVYPDAPNGLFEYYTDTGRTREAQFVRDVIGLAVDELPADASRVFVTGMSGGATMANALGCRLGPRVIRGLGIHSGTLYPVNDGNGVPDFTYIGTGGVSCPLPETLFIWGKADNLEGTSFADGESVRDNYLATQACQETSQAWSVTPCVSYNGCGRAVVWCPVEGLGHAVWRQAGPALWRFFDGLR